MNKSDEKIKRLIEISKLYYEQDKTQSEIANLYQVSRPLISRMLKEAKEMGIVHIEICQPSDGNQIILNQVRNAYHIFGGVIAPNKSNENMTNESLIASSLEYMKSLHQKNYGIGWGGIIGQLISTMEKSEVNEGFSQKVCPLVGNSGVSNRNYHSNELVRIFAERTNSQPNYLYAPALAATEQELRQIKELENYKVVFDEWSHLDVALVNIGNYPSTPDFASVVRYGEMLKKRKAVGRLLNYYFDLKGDILYSDMDYAIQIPLELLARTQHVVGIAGANIHCKALLGAMRTGIFQHIIAPENQTKEALEIEQNS